MRASFIFSDTMIHLVFIYHFSNTEWQLITLEWLLQISWVMHHQGLYIPWKVTGMSHSTSALAISDRSLALRISMYAGLWEPGAATMVNSTPVGPAQDYHKRISIVDSGLDFNMLCFYWCWRTIILIDPFRILNKQRLWGVWVGFLPYPGLLGPHVQLADLHTREKTT